MGCAALLYSARVFFSLRCAEGGFAIGPGVVGQEQAPLRWVAEDARKWRG
jgi:hypothetical protein